MKKIITGDGSITFHNPEFDDIYHSTSGALEEAFGKFVTPCRIAELAVEPGSLRILDICFGLGYNSCAAIDAAKSANPGVRVQITALERDPGIIAMIGELEPELLHYGLIKHLAASRDAAIDQDGIALKLILGDALETIEQLLEGFDAVFHDPFSPRKNPELWTEGFFRRVYRLMKPGAILATYSCAKRVRKALEGVGFTVGDGPCIGRRSPSTVALKP
jgi:chorismate dehydratase